MNSNAVLIFYNAFIISYVISHPVKHFKHMVHDEYDINKLQITKNR